MKALVFVLGLIAAFALCPASYANPLTFIVTNGTFESGATFSGTYTVNSLTDAITGGQFTVNEAGFTDTITTEFHAFPPGPGIDATEGDFEGLFGQLYFATTTSLTAPILCVWDNRYTCESPTIYGYGNPIDPTDDYATGATITLASNISPTPEPSSLILLATGALSAIPIIRRRLAQRA